MGRVHHRPTNRPHLRRYELERPQSRTPMKRRLPTPRRMDSAAREVVSCIAAKFQTNIGPSRVFDQNLDETIFETASDLTQKAAANLIVSTPRPKVAITKLGKKKRTQAASSLVQITEVEEFPVAPSKARSSVDDPIVIDDESDLEIEVLQVVKKEKPSSPGPEVVELIDIAEEDEESTPGTSGVVHLDLDKEEAILRAELLAQISKKDPKPMKQPKPFISSYFKPVGSGNDDRRALKKIMPKFPPIPIVDSIFSCGSFGNYAARYRRSHEDPLKKFARRRVDSDSFRNFKYRDLPTHVFVDALSYHSHQQCGVPLRVWAEIQKTENGVSLPSIRVCSYNVLCQPTIGRTLYLYRHVNPSSDRCLEWTCRWNLLAKELNTLQADVFCLQEVFYEHYDANFAPFMEKLGYVGRYQRKTGGTMDVVDGCAIFYRKKLFEEVCYRPVMMYARDGSVLDKPNIGQVIRLRHRETNREICVANTHLIYNTKSGHRKFAQLALLLAHLKEVCDYRDPSRPESVERPRPEYILCGDFNMEPFSDIYRFIIEKQLDLNQCKQKEMSGQGETDSVVGVLMEPPRETGLKSDCTLAKDGEKYSLLDGLWSHEFNFASSYFHLKSRNQHDCSNFNKQGFNPDFVFYSVQQAYVNEDDTIQVKEGGLRLVRRLELPEISEASQTLGPWPNPFTPSDHVPLLVDFALM